LFAWAREERIIPANPALELRTGWGGSVRRRVLIPSIPQVIRLAEALDHFKHWLGDVAMVLAFPGCVGKRPSPSRQRTWISAASA
jgi:hypothetical protein